MSLKLQINEDMKTAMRAKDSARLGALRLLLAAIKQREVDERIELDDAAVMAIVEKQLKQRRDSVAQFDQAGRNDLASAERFEIEVLSAYMPAQMSEAEIDAAVDAAITETGASGPGGMGKLMAALKPKLAGRADMTLVSARVKARLSA
ncbi:GatB/YqeY domain-containing protein [Niveibacterium sp. 24ML]|uniref:GatB/YqeY domain-containing protein n=1 Tax=Niveibacterium sp. 24ML TaxID=2985512 RepID=UPI00227214EA|nr:GatB/YqeY domain-containing protein [Niveibacterium sp. 24ML]MCX9154563.1 GatB/YqeY domain-containing protein [Niveibacterium sp. 24ML]